jgi:nucleoside-diphosphate-sugar epimerase
VLRDLSEVTGLDAGPIYRPPRPGDIKHSHADITAAETDLGYSVGVSFAAGLEQTYEYYRDITEGSGRMEIQVADRG